MRCGGFLHFFHPRGPLFSRAAALTCTAHEGKGIHPGKVASLTMEGTFSRKSRPEKERHNSNNRAHIINHNNKSNKNKNGGISLAEFHPGIAQGWLVAVSSKLLRPQHTLPISRKMVWWCCPNCQFQFTKRIDLHVADGGACPECRAKPSLIPENNSITNNNNKKNGELVNSSSSSLSLRPERRYRCRPGNASTCPEVENVNRLKKNIVDDDNVDIFERRNLMPMLAKNYEKESGKIAPDELIYVAPKLDGIRCIAAYDSTKKEILFFSRSGTLFECCDAKIAPALRWAFEKDPRLVLDGELYNDSANLAKSFSLMKNSPHNNNNNNSGKPSSSSLVEENLIGLFSCDLAAPDEVDGGFVERKSAKSIKFMAKRPQKARENFPAPIPFEKLASAIRTMRERRTPKVFSLQAALQYHIFDLLDAGAFSPSSPAPSFTLRYAHLRELLHDLRCHHAGHREKVPKNNNNSNNNNNNNNGCARGNGEDVLRLVPALPCVKADVDGLLRAAMRCGYEGVMIRRDSSTGNHIKLSDIENKDDSDETEETNALGEIPLTSTPLTLKVVKQRLADVARVMKNLSPNSSTKKNKKKGRVLTSSSASSSAGGGYAYGQRSGTLLKYKIMRDDEFIIVAAVEGKGKWKGGLGAFVCQTKDGKNTFTVTPASSDEEKKKMWKSWQSHYKGKALTVQYQELTADGIPRFPVGKCVRGESDGRDWI